MPEPRVYPIAERPDVEVLVDDEWRFGSLRMWKWVDGAWVANVGYSSAVAENRIGDFPEDRIRLAPEPD